MTRRELRAFWLDYMNNPKFSDRAYMLAAKWETCACGAFSPGPLDERPTIRDALDFDRATMAGDIGTCAPISVRRGDAEFVRFFARAAGVLP